MPAPPLSLITRAAGGEALTDEEALALAEVGPDALSGLFDAARAVRDRRWARRVTFSPKVFLPLTNLCRNRCGYCSFRASPHDDHAATMAPRDIAAVLEAGREQGCAEALFCLGDKPETVFPSYQRELAGYGHGSTVEYLHWGARLALSLGFLPHTNAGILTLDDMRVLREVNVSLGLMLETSSARLSEKRMPHANAPDKRPERRLKMIDEAGIGKIPFTTGILIGIGETRRERVESLLAIREAHARHGHIQEVIVQSFRVRPGIPMQAAPEPTDDEVAHAVAVARLILPPDIGVQAPPNLNPDATALLLAAGINDFGGISPVTKDFINPHHPWPHLGRLADVCAHEGYTLEPRLPVYDAYVDTPGFLDPALVAPTLSVRARLRAVANPARLADGVKPVRRSLDVVEAP